MAYDFWHDSCNRYPVSGEVPRPTARKGMEGGAMHTLEQRILIYASLVVTCGVVGVFLGLIAGISSFVQVAAVLELLYLFQ